MWLHTAVLLAVASALYFPLDYRAERCFGLKLPAAQPFSGAYLVTGQGERNVLSRLESPSKRVLYHGTPKSHEGKFELTSEEEGLHRFCFKAFDRWPKNVSLEFTTPQVEPELPTEEMLEPLYKEVKRMQRALETVMRNVQFTKQQERTHRDLTESTCDRVLWCAIIKVVVLSVVTVVQISVLKRVGGGSGGKV